MANRNESVLHHLLSILGYHGKQEGICIASPTELLKETFKIIVCQVAEWRSGSVLGP